MTLAAHTHHSAPTHHVTAGNVSFAYRRLGESKGRPLVLFQHFTGSMDNWDPLIIDGLARDREVIIFDNAGVAGSTGTTPDTVEAMARDAASFLDALKIQKSDLLGFSLGGMIAQQLAIDRGDLVGELILAGTGPRGGEGMATFAPGTAYFFFEKKYDKPNDLWLDVLFAPSEASQRHGRSFLERMQTRVTDRDLPANEKVGPAQLAAVGKWGTVPEIGRYSDLKKITQRALVVNGSNDIVLPTVNSFILQQHLPNAQLLLYPDSNHGAQYQFPEDFLAQVKLFLSN
jgi:pimeloyl-ACP methyl ester carboxylesterase